MKRGRINKLTISIITSRTCRVDKLIDRTVMMVIVVVMLQIRWDRVVQFGCTATQCRYAVSSPHVVLAIGGVIVLAGVVVVVAVVAVVDVDTAVAVSGPQRLLTTAAVVVVHVDIVVRYNAMMVGVLVVLLNDMW